MPTIELLNSICVELKEAKTIDRESIIINCISQRLDQSLDNYMNSLDKDVEYLKYRRNLSIVRKLSK